VRDSDRSLASVPGGDRESMDRSRERTIEMSTRAAVSTALMGVDLPASLATTAVLGVEPLSLDASSKKHTNGSGAFDFGVAEVGWCRVAVQKTGPIARLITPRLRLRRLGQRLQYFDETVSGSIMASWILRWARQPSLRPI
jgi:hypothetical protein